jgi:hypothetical protein
VVRIIVSPQSRSTTTMTTTMTREEQDAGPAQNRM